MVLNAVLRSLRGSNLEIFKVSPPPFPPHPPVPTQFTD